MTDDVMIAIFNRKCKDPIKPIIKCEGDTIKEVRAIALCGRCKAALGTSDVCEMCGAPADWGF